MIDYGKTLVPIYCASVFVILVAAAHDIAFRTVPNSLVLGVAVLGLGRCVISGLFEESLIAAGTVFLLAMLCWRFRWLGGGDAKLLAAACIGIPAASVPSFIAAVAFSGGGLALVYLTTRTFLPNRPSQRPISLIARICRVERWRLSRGGPLPYACAIASGFLLAAH